MRQHGFCARLVHAGTTRQRKESRRTAHFFGMWCARNTLNQRIKERRVGVRCRRALAHDSGVARVTCARADSSSLLWNRLNCSAPNCEMHTHAIAHRLNLNARKPSSALRKMLTARALDLVFIRPAKRIAQCNYSTIRSHFPCAPNAPRYAHSTRQVRHWSAVHRAAVTHLVPRRSAQCVDYDGNPTSHRFRKDNARRSSAHDQTFTRMHGPLRTAFTPAHKKCTENKGWQDWLAPALGTMYLHDAAYLSSSSIACPIFS